MDADAGARAGRDHPRQSRQGVRRARARAALQRRRARGRSEWTATVLDAAAAADARGPAEGPRVVVTTASRSATARRSTRTTTSSTAGTPRARSRRRRRASASSATRTCRRSSRPRDDPVRRGADAADDELAPAASRPGAHQRRVGRPAARRRPARRVRHSRPRREHDAVAPRRLRHRRRASEDSRGGAAGVAGDPTGTRTVDLGSRVPEGPGFPGFRYRLRTSTQLGQRFNLLTEAINTCTSSRDCGTTRAGGAHRWPDVASV